jgi:hypothetical protein
MVHCITNQAVCLFQLSSLMKQCERSKIEMHAILTSGGRFIMTQLYCFIIFSNLKVPWLKY